MADRFSVMKRFDFKTPARIFIKCAAAAVLSSALILSGCSDKSAVSSDAPPEIIIGVTNTSRTTSATKTAILQA